MVDLDNIFKYCTPKYVYIRDAKLGIMKYTLMGLIFMYVVVYNIFMTCDHLAPYPAQGFGTISLQHPVDNCDELDKDCMAKYHNIGQLPYCTQYEGDKSLRERRLADDQDAEEDGKAQKDAKKDAKAPEDAKKDAKAPEDAKKDAKAPEDSKKDFMPPKDAKGDGKSPSTTKAPPPEQYKGSEKVGEKISGQKMCRYLDNRRLEWESGVPSEAFIPTHYKQVRQKINPDCYNPEIKNHVPGVEGSKRYRCKSGWITETVKDFYVADIEQFTLRMSHSFSAPAIGKFGESTDYQGLFAACPTNHPLDIAAECKRAKVPNTAGNIAPEDEAGLVSVEELGAPSLTGGPAGRDAIDFGDFLKTTPIAQHYESIKENPLDARLPESFGHPKTSLRESGGMLLLDVDYTNVGANRPGIPGLPDSMQIKPTTYNYRPYFVPTTENKKYQLVERSDHDDYRVIDIWYGVTIKMQFNGQLVDFTWSRLLKGLTTGLVLLSMATTLVCYAASFVLPLSEKYNALMYQMSEDVSDYTAYRNSRSGWIESVINPLGLMEAKEWAAEPTVFSNGHKLYQTLKSDGTVDKVLANEDIVKILCTNEMRLARLDGMDTRMIFTEASDENPINRCIRRHNNAFYNEEKKVPGFKPLD